MPAPRQPATPAIVFSNGRRTRKKIALTFDACATRKLAGFDRRIIRILQETKTPATLFLGGKWMLDFPDETRRLAYDSLFELGSHSFLHPHMKTLTNDSIRKDLQLTQDIMFSLTGRQSTLFRPPYGEYDERIVQLAAELGMTTVMYDLASGDPDSTITNDQLVTYVSQCARKGSIIVMHMNGRGWHTAKALPEIITSLKRRGFQFVTVGSLMMNESERGDDL
ncbi:MAG: polysaccharide deacetylase family protein [bacterium]